MATILWLALFGILIFIFLSAGKQNEVKDTDDHPDVLRSRAKMISMDRPATTFRDVAGADEAKQELMEIVQCLQWPERFNRLGARLPHGVLLIGPPGTGKTLLARAVAGEAHVPFFATSGAAFVEMFVGAGASRVRDLFKQAKLHAPSIVFIDEIDALGRRRGVSADGGGGEHDQTLNQVLVEMDGFDTADNVVVIAATNRPDILDSALVRPGRFDRQVVLDVPDERGRLEILAVHSRGKRLDASCNLHEIAEMTPGFTGADLANLLNEAAIVAVRQGRQTVGMAEMKEAVDLVIGGPERKSRVIGATDRARMACHEAGHGLIARRLPTIGAIHKLSIIPRLALTDCTHLLPGSDRRLRTRRQLEEMLVFLLAGNEAERLVFGETSTRGANDLTHASDVAYEMVTAYGMNAGLGPIALHSGGPLIMLPRGAARDNDHSSATAEEVDREVSALLERAAGMARSMLRECEGKLIVLTDRLAVDGTVESDAIDGMIGPPQPPLPQAAIDLRGRPYL